MKAYNIHGDKYEYLTEYSGCDKKILIKCKICSHTYEQTPDAHFVSKGCFNSECFNFCGSISTKGSTTEEFIKKARIKHKKLYNYDFAIYNGCDNNLIILCTKCGNKFEQTPNNHLSGSGCPHCKKSNSELYIKNILDDFKINYKPQYIFEDLKYKDHLKFDFGILDSNNNLICLIEYNGEQHYKYNKFFHQYVPFEISQFKDGLKLTYCIDNNIDLLVIRYDEDLEEEINKFLIEYFKPSPINY